MAQLFKMAFSGVGKSLAKTAPMRFLCRSNDLRMKELGACGHHQAGCLLACLLACLRAPSESVPFSHFSLVCAIALFPRFVVPSLLCLCWLMRAPVTFLCVDLCLCVCLCLCVLVPPGLLYEDILIDTPAVKRAIERLPADEQQARWRRIKRAIDLDLKHKTLPPEQWVDPRESYLAEHLADVERLEAERASMDMD